MREAIDLYHSLLTPEVAEASHVMLEDQLRRRNLVFGGRALCTVLRPRLFETGAFRTLEQRIRRLMRAFARADEAARNDSAIRAQFRLADWEETLYQADPGYKSSSPSGRLDTFLVEETGVLALTEYNAETPAGAGYNDVLTSAFEALPVMRAFRRHFTVRPLPGRPGVATVLLDAWEQFSGRRDPPRIAIVDWDDVPTASEFQIFQDYFQGLGLACEITTPGALEYRGGRLYGPAGAIDVIYKRVLIHELVERGGLSHPMVRAVRERAVCMVNPFRCKPLHKKASLAVLSDERNAQLFDGEMQAAIATHIPWTRVVEQRNTTYRGQPVDLVPFIAGNRDRLVLKPNDDYGGAGIVLGWTVDQAGWQAGIEKALAEPYIVQERVQIPAEPYPSWIDGRLEVFDRMLDTAPFVCNGEYLEGCLTRLSTAALLNVTAGGGSTVPCFMVERRS